MNYIIHIIRHTARAATVLLLALLTTATAWASSFSGGSGTKADPYKISSSADLVQLATDINNSTSRLYEDQYFVQTGNINMSGINFVPIGINDNYYHQFRGKYNGQNYTISNLTVNGSYDYAGLFGYIYNGDIDNVRLVSPSITNTKTSYTSALVGFGNMPGIHNCLVISPTLSGGNSIGVFAGGQNAGNIKYTYYTGNNNYSNVGYTDGSNANTSIGHAYTLTLSGGATTSNAAAFTYNSTDYYAGTITLSNAAPAGWIYAYTVNGSPIDGTSFTINADATVALSRTPDPTHFSDNGDGSYTIKTATGWNVFCDLLADNAKGYFSGKTVRLGDDITVTRMAGGDSHEFTGTFDGDGKTLTVNYTNNSNDVRTAPFSYVNGATIQNLIVGGTISGTAYRAAGIVGETPGQTTITNCVSSVDISSGRYTGGFSIGGNVEIEGCVFNGKINGTDRSGGFIGYSYSAQVLKNSLFAPQDGSSISGGTFYFNGGGDVAPVNSYYTQALGTAQGKACHSVTAGTDVTIGAIALTGDATQYTVSGITAYSGGGLQRGETIYYGSDDQLSLTLSNTAQCDQPGYQYGYTASAGTLSGTTLTMPDKDVTINAAIRSDGLEHEVSYMTADGTTQTAPAIALDGHEAVDGAGDINLDAGTYYVGTDITYANRINLNGDVTLILANGKTMTLASNMSGIYGSYNLTIYGQSLDDDAGTIRYNGTSHGIYISNYEQHSGNVSITTTTTGSSVHGIDANVTLRGGTLTISAKGNKARAIIGIMHSILGGQLTANATGIYATASSGTAITLGWTRPADFITASSFSTDGGTVAVADGQALTDGSGHIYTGTLTDEQKEAIAGKTLQPAALAQYIDANGQPAEHTALILDGTETSLAAGWYFVGKDISYTATVTLDGDVNLILADGKTMNVTTSDYARCIYAPDGQSLHIYGQSEGTGVLNAQTQGDADAVIKFLDGTLAIHGGNVEATIGGTPFSANTIHIARETAGDALVIDRGTLTATANKGTGIYIDGGNARINGGQVAATGTSSGIDIRDHSTIPGILTLSGGTLTASGFYTFSAWDYAGTLAVASGLTYTDGTSLYDSNTETATLAALGGKTLQPALLLADAADNNAAIAAHAGQTLAVALSGRTLYKDGSWNTLCLPFSVSTASGTLSGNNVQAMTLDTETSNLTGGTLTLNFDDATTIPAGTPFIIKWDESGTDIENPVFEDVTIVATNHDATVTGVLTFTGTYAPVTIADGGDNTKLYLGSGNKLYYPNAVMTIGTHRAYFQLADGITAGNSAGGIQQGGDVDDDVRAFVLNFGDDEANGITTTDYTNLTDSSDPWYTLDGVKLAAKPTAKGLYIHGGKKVAIK